MFLNSGVKPTLSQLPTSSSGGKTAVDADLNKLN